MMFSEQNQEILNEVFYNVGSQVKKQNKVLGCILGCFFIASVVLFCIYII